MADHETEKSPAQTQTDYGKLPGYLNTMGVLETSEPRRFFMEGVIGEPTDSFADDDRRFALEVPVVTGSDGIGTPPPKNPDHPILSEDGGLEPDEIIRFLESQGYATASVFEATATDEAADRMQEVYMSTDEYNFRSQLNSLLPLEVKRPVFIRHRDIPMDEFLSKHGLNLADGRDRTTEEAEIAIMTAYFISAIIDNPLGIYSRSARRGKRSLLADGVDENIINEAIELGLAARAGIDREIEAIIDSANPQTDSNRWFGALLAYRAALHNKAVHTGRSEGCLRSLGDTIIDIDRAVAANSLGQLIGDDSNALVLGWDTDKYDPAVGMRCAQDLYDRVNFDWESLLRYSVVSQRLRVFLDELFNRIGGFEPTRDLSKDDFDKIMADFLKMKDEIERMTDSGEDSELAQLWQYKLDVSSKIGKASRSFL